MRPVLKPSPPAAGPGVTGNPFWLRLPPRLRWAPHNLLGHPLMELLHLVGARAAAERVHAWSQPPQQAAQLKLPEAEDLERALEVVQRADALLLPQGPHVPSPTSKAWVRTRTLYRDVFLAARDHADEKRATERQEAT